MTSPSFHEASPAVETSPPKLGVSRARRSTAALAVAVLFGMGLTSPVMAATVASATPVSADLAESPTVPSAPVVKTGDTWNYLDDNTDPAVGEADLRVWTTPGYDDSTWKNAPSGFGVKNNALAAVGSFMPVTQLNHYIDQENAPTVPTYFFRTSFELEAGVAEQVAALTAEVSYDDALVVWINGAKVASFVDGRITGTTNLEYAGDSQGNPVTSTFSASNEVLQDGENTVAVALYQDREDSSDAYFDMSSLKLTPAGTPGETVEVPPSRVILTPTETPAVSQSFSWLAGDVSHTTGQVEIAEAGGTSRLIDAYAVGVVSTSPQQHFSATVDELTPATKYRYRVGLEGSWSPWHEFTTADPADTDFQFVYYGDAQIGLDSTWPEVVRQAEARATDSIGSVHAGDLIDTSSNETQWTNWFTGMEHSAATTNVMAAPGNHEYSGDKLLSAWKANFEYPRNNPASDTIGELANLAQGDSDGAKQYAAYFAHWAEFAAETVYFADYQGVRFITLNATRDTTFLTPENLPSCSGTECPQTQVAKLWTEYQAAWLDYILAESPSKWNVVTFHQPVYSTSSGRDEPVLRDAWVPVFEKHNIDLVLMGHDHTYARGFKDSTKTETAGITDGPVYAVSNSGAKHYDLAPEGNNVWTNNDATQVLRGEGVTTYQVIDVSADNLVYRSYLAEKTADATTEKQVGDLYDEVTITKYSTGQKWVTEAGIEAPEGPQLSVDAEAITAGESAMLSGSGFIAETALALELRSEPVPLGTAAVDAAGQFEIEVTIPAATSAGSHTIVAMLENGAEIQLPVTILAAPTTGDDDISGDPEGTTAGEAADGAADGSDAEGTAAGNAADGSAGAGAGGSGSGTASDASGTAAASGTPSAEPEAQGSGSNAATNPAAQRDRGASALATTGAQTTAMVVGAMALLVVGGLLIVLRHRQRVQTELERSPHRDLG